MGANFIHGELNHLQTEGGGERLKQLEAGSNYGGGIAILA